jgi:hypothetical protein
VWSFTVTVRDEGDHPVVTVSPVQSDSRSAAPQKPDAAVPARPTDDSSATLRKVGWGLAIGSAVGFVFAATFAAVAASKNSQSNRDGHCDATGCDPTGVALRNDALSSASVATVAAITGGVLAASSVTVLVVGSSHGATSSATQVPRPALGVQWTGRF